VTVLLNDRCSTRVFSGRENITLGLENMMPRKMFGPKRRRITEAWEALLYVLLIKRLSLGQMDKAEFWGHVGVWDRTRIHTGIFGREMKKGPLGKPRYRWG
jgi:hypothetical protein